MVFLILIVGALIRLIGLFRPLLGNFATKQVAYAMMAKNFASDLRTVFSPTLDLLVNGQKSLHMNEWPFYSYFIGFVYRLVPFISVDVLGRFFSVVFFVFSGLFVYFLCKGLLGRSKAIVALFFYMFFPWGIVYGQSVQLEASVMFFLSLMLLGIFYWSEGKKNLFIAVIIWIGATITLLMKIQLICLALPAVALLFRGGGFPFELRKSKFYIYSISCLVLPVLWYKYTFHVAENYQNVFFSISQGIGSRVFPDPRIFTMEFYLRIFRYLMTIVFSPIGFALATIGVIFYKRLEKRTLFFVAAFCISIAIYCIVLPRKVYEMNYYYIPFIIPGAILCMNGLYVFKNKLARGAILSGFAVLSFLIAFNPAYKTPENEIMFIEKSETLKTKIPENSKVIVSSEGAPIAFFYYINRPGWNITLIKGEAYADDAIFSIEKYVNNGAQYFVYDDASGFKKDYPVLWDYLVINYEVLEGMDCLVVKLRTDDL